MVPGRDRRREQRSPAQHRLLCSGERGSRPRAGCAAPLLRCPRQKGRRRDSLPRSGRRIPKGRLASMIWPLLFATQVAVSPVPAPARQGAHDLLVAARTAIQGQRLAEGTAIVARAVGAGASGPELDRVMADLAFASGRFAEAGARYEALLKVRPSDKSLLEPAGI